MKTQGCVWLSVVNMKQGRTRRRIAQPRSGGPQVKKKSEKGVVLLKHVKNHPSFKAMSLGKQPVCHKKQKLKLENQEKTQNTPDEESTDVFGLNTENQIISQCLENTSDSKQQLQSTVYSMDMNCGHVNCSSSVEDIDFHYRKEGINVNENKNDIPIKEMLVGTSSMKSPNKLDISQKVENRSISDQKNIERSKERDSFESEIIGTDHEERCMLLAQKRSKCLLVKGIETSRTPKFCLKKSDDMDIVCYDAKESSETTCSCNLEDRQVDDYERASEEDIVSQRNVSRVSGAMCDAEISFPSLDNCCNKLGKFVRNSCLEDFEEMPPKDTKELYCQEHLRSILQIAGVVEKENSLVACPRLPVSNELVFAAINYGPFSHDHVYYWLCKTFKKSKKSCCTKISQTQYLWFKELHSYISSLDRKVGWENILQNTLYSPPKCSELCLIFNLSDCLKDEVIDFYRHVQGKKDPSFSNKFCSGKSDEIGEPSEVGKDSTLVKIVQASHGIGGLDKNNSNLRTNFKGEAGKLESEYQDTKSAKFKAASEDHQYHAIVEELRGAIRNVRLLTSSGKLITARNEDNQKRELDEGVGKHFDGKKKSSDGERGGKCVKHFDSVLHNLYLLMRGKRASEKNFQKILKEFYWKLRQVESTLHFQRKEIERKQAKIKAAEVENQQLVKSHEELRKDLEKSKFEVKTKCIHNLQLKKLIKEANDKISARDSTIRQMESERKSMKTKLRNLEECVTVLRSECKSTELQCKEMMIKNDEAAGREEQAKNREAEMLAQINHQTHLLKQSEKAAKLKDSLMSVMCLELKSLQEKVQALTSDNMQYEGKIKDLESLIEQNKSTEANILNKLSEKNIVIPQLDKANEILRSQVTLLKESEGDLLAQKERLSTHLQELEERLVCCCSIMSENEKTIKQLKDVVMESQNETKRKEQDIVKLNEKILNLESDIRDKNSFIEQGQQETSYFTDALTGQYEQFKVLNDPQHCMALQTTSLTCVGVECVDDQIGNGYALLGKEKHYDDCLSELVVLLKNRKDELCELTSALRELEIKFRKNLEFACPAQDPLNISTLVEDVTMLIFTSMETSEKITTFLDHRTALQTVVNTVSKKPTVNIKCCINKQELNMTQHLSSREESKSLRVYVKSSLDYDITSVNEKNVDCYDMQVQDTLQPKHQIKCLDFISRTKNKVTKSTKEPSGELFSRSTIKGNVSERRNSYIDILSKDASLERQDHTAFTKNRSHKDGRHRDTSITIGKISNISCMSRLNKVSRERVSVIKKQCTERTEAFTTDRKGKECIMKKGASTLDSLPNIPSVKMSCPQGKLCDSSLKKQFGKNQMQADFENKCASGSKHLILFGNQHNANQVKLSENQRRQSITDFDARCRSPSLERKKYLHRKISRDVATSDSDRKSLRCTYQKMIREEDVISVYPEDLIQVAGVNNFHCQEKENTVIKRVLKIESGVLQTCGTDEVLSEDLCTANDSSPSKRKKHEEPVKLQEHQKNSDISFVQDRLMMDAVCNFTGGDRLSSSSYITGNEDQHRDTNSLVLDQDSEQDSKSEKIRLDIMQSCGHVLKHLQREMDMVTEDSITDNYRQVQATGGCQEKSLLYPPFCSEGDETSESVFRASDKPSLSPDAGMKFQSFEATGLICLLPEFPQLEDARGKDMTVNSKGKCYRARSVTCGKELASFESSNCKQTARKEVNDGSSFATSRDKDWSYEVSEGKMEREAGDVGIKLRLEEKYYTKSREKKKEQIDRKQITTRVKADRDDAQKQNYGERCGGNTENKEAVKDKCVDKEPRRDRQHVESSEKNKIIFDWLKGQTFEIDLRNPVASGKKRKIDCEPEEKHSMQERKGSKHQLFEKTPIQDDESANKFKKFHAIENWHENHTGCSGVERGLKGENQGVELRKEKVPKINELRDRNTGRETVREGTSRIKVTDEGKSNDNEKEVIDSESGVVRRTVTSVLPASSQTKSKTLASEARALKRGSVLQERDTRRGIILARMWQKIASLQKQRETADEHFNMLEKDNDSLVILLQEKNAALKKAIQEKRDVEAALKGKENALELCHSNALKRKAFISNLKKERHCLLEKNENLKKEHEKCAIEIMALNKKVADNDKSLSQKIDIIKQQGNYIGELLRQKVEAENAWKAEREDADRDHVDEMKLKSERLIEKESLIGNLLIEKAKIEGLLEAKTKDANERQHLLSEKEKCLSKAVKERLLLERSLKASMTIYYEQKAVIAEREKSILQLQKEKIDYETLSRILAEQLHGKECTATANEDQKEPLQEALKLAPDHQFSYAESLQISSYSAEARFLENVMGKDDKCTVFQKDSTEVLSAKTEDQQILMEEAYPSVDFEPLPMSTDNTSKIQLEFHSREMNTEMDGNFDKENAVAVLMEERKMAVVLKEEHWVLKKSFIQIHSKIRAIKKEFNLLYEDDIKECKTERKIDGGDKGKDSHPNLTPGNENDQLPESSKLSERDSNYHNRIFQYETGDPDVGTLISEIDGEIDSFVLVKSHNLRLEKNLQTVIKEKEDLGKMIDELVREKIELDKTLNQLLAKNEDLSKKLMEKEDELCKEREFHTHKFLDEERKNLEYLFEKNQELMHEASTQQRVIDGYIAELKECKIEIGKKESIGVDLQKKSECIKELKSQIKSLKKELDKGNKEKFEMGKVIDSLLQEQDDLKLKLQTADMQLKTEINEHCSTKNKFAYESGRLKESLEEREQLTQALLSQEQQLHEHTENWQTEKRKLLKNASEQESLNLKLLKDKEQWQIKLQLREKKYHLLLRDKGNVFRSEVNILNEQFNSLKEFNSWLMDQYNYLATSRFRLRSTLNLHASKNLQSIPTSQEIEEVQPICSALPQKEGEVDTLKYLLCNEEAKSERVEETFQDVQLKTDGVTKNFHEYQVSIEAAEENSKEACNSKEALLAKLQEEQLKNRNTLLLLSEKAMKVEYAEKCLRDQQNKIDAYEKLLQEGQIRATLSYRIMQEEQRKSEALRIALQEEQLRMENVSYALLGEQAQDDDVTAGFDNRDTKIEYEAEIGSVLQNDQACQTEVNGEDYASYQEQITRLQYDWNLEKMTSRYFCGKLIEEYVDAKDHLEFELDLMKSIIDRQLKTKARLRELLAYNTDDANL